MSCPDYQVNSIHLSISDADLRLKTKAKIERQMLWFSNYKYLSSKNLIEQKFLAILLGFDPTSLLNHTHNATAITPTSPAATPATPSPIPLKAGVAIAGAAPALDDDEVAVASVAAAVCEPVVVVLSDAFAVVVVVVAVAPPWFPYSLAYDDARLFALSAAAEPVAPYSLAYEDARLSALLAWLIAELTAAEAPDVPYVS